jgi:hypothetical protein
MAAAFQRHLGAPVRKPNAALKFFEMLPSCADAAGGDAGATSSLAEGATTLDPKRESSWRRPRMKKPNGSIGWSATCSP